MNPGFLFTASEFANHVMYNILDIGDEDPNPIRTFSSDKKGKIVAYNPR